MQVRVKVAKEATLNIQAYLMDPNDEGVDEWGNTSVHQLTKVDHSEVQLEGRIKNQPQMLFMLNKDGYTPLDKAITEKDEQKARFLILKAQKYTNNCSLKFIKRPNRLDLKYEKSFTLAL